VLAHAAAVLTSIGLMAGTAGAPPTCSALAIQARYVDVPEASILFEVRSDQPCTMYEADLPWGNFYSIAASVRDASGKVCQRLTAPIDDPEDTVVSLKPGHVATGRVALAPHCARFAALVAKEPVTVEWQYTPVHRRTNSERPKGRIVVPRKR
jgi:hypothetical protein